MTNRAPRSNDEELADGPPPEASAERVTPELLTPSLVTPTAAVSVNAGRPSAASSPAASSLAASSPAASADTAVPEEVVSSALSGETEELEPSSRELTDADLDAELDMQGLAASSVGEPSDPPPEDPPPEDPQLEELGLEEVVLETEEVTADQLLQDDEAPSVPIESNPSGPFVPWVDQVADPVTPYEQRVSETIKVADLPPVEQLRGRVLANRYLAEEVAEQTAVSLSYRAYHLALDRAVTVRILPRGLACSDELCQEVRSVARVATLLEHPNVAATLDFGVTTDGWPFLVTEHLQGRSLGLLLAEESKFVLRRVLHLGKQLAAGLGAAHQAGLVHGFLSPDNVMVIEPGTSAEVAMILGFGMHAARGVTPAPPRSGVFGAPFYVSPEQAGCRPLDARSDLYSLGVILYELMTGAPPFAEGDFAAVLCQHLDDDAEPPSSRLPSPGALAKAMDAIVERLLRKDPEQRYQTAAELADDLIRLEATAARNKRRPMPEIQRPTSMIHSPPARADSSHGAQGAKVIVHDEPEELREEASGAGGEARGSSPGSTPGVPPVRAGTTVPPRSAVTGAKRPHRVSVDQATIKISAVDRDLAMALHRKHHVVQSWGAPRQGVLAALGASLVLAWQWVVRLFGGGPSKPAPTDRADD
ncbi:MAG: serine/threonine-protein kinase [Deltaproteobacteria bacterium]